MYQKDQGPHIGQLKIMFTDAGGHKLVNIIGRSLITGLLTSFRKSFFAWRFVQKKSFFKLLS